MCLILFAAGVHPRYPLIVAANRDESYARPAAPAGDWPDGSGIHGGRDLEQGGTWLAIARSGRFAALTNYRQGTPRAPLARSRGELTRDFLGGRDDPSTYATAIAGRAGEYNGYSLIFGEGPDLWFYSNRGGAPRRIEPGVHGLSNHLLDEPWPKVRRGIDTIRDLLAADEPTLVSRLTRLLEERTPAPDHLLPSTGVSLERERALSASFIAAEHYGTRASTIVLMRADGEVLFRERRYGPCGVAAGESEARFPTTVRVSSAALRA